LEHPKVLERIAIQTALGHVATLERFLECQEKRLTVRVGETAAQLRWLECSYERLELTHIGALCLLEGASLQSLLGEYLLLSCVGRPIYSPRPGADQVIVALVRNHCGLSVADTFMAIHGAYGGRKAER
jgi:hypothetical protein